MLSLVIAGDAEVDVVALEYRRDIDGLRAISVASVLFFHYGFGLSGGFIGVDVFFVISGFLITSILYSEMAEGRFSILGFYDRRFRRIAPALLVVLLSTLVFGFFLLFPEDYERLCEQLAYAAFASSNFYFMNNSGYFDPASDTQPLLHLWSLAVEEQFYLFWPLLLVAIGRLAAWRTSAVLASVLAMLICGSAALSILITGSEQAFAFYMLPTRAWELALGGLLVFLPPLHGLTSRLAPITGLILVCGTAFLLDDTIPFPGWVAMIPCVGAALIIWPRALAVASDRLLGFPPLVFLGKISYSLYLWHWPAIVFARQATPSGELSFWTRVALALVCLSLAALTWLAVEQPFRRWHPSRYMSIAAGLTGSAALAMAAALIVYAGGFPSRFPPNVNEMLAYKSFDVGTAYRQGTCFLRADQTAADFDVGSCIGTNSVVLWGDSYAAHYFRALQALLPTGVGQATASGCPPIVGLVASDRPNCKSFNDAILAQLTKQPPATVVLSAFWAVWRVDFDLLDRTIARLTDAGVNVLVVGQSPVYRENVPDILAKRISFGNLDTLSEDDDVWPDALGTDQLFKEHFAGDHRYISTVEAICRQNRCPLLTHNIPVHWDDGHFTSEGAMLFARSFAYKVFASSPDRSARLDGR